MATRFNLIRLVVSYALAAAMLAACGGSQVAGSAVGTAPQAAGGPNAQHSSMRPADDGGGCGGGDTHGGIGPNDGGGCCGGGDGGSWRGIGVRSNDEGGHHCKNISVTPHVIFFTASNPGPVTVTVKTQQAGTVSEIDDCGGASGIAMLMEGTGSASDQWTVTAGSQTGSCKALFILTDSSGKRIGHAVLHITNFI